MKGGGPTVKNVTGYDLPRLLVGSLGTLGVLVQVTLRCQPRPATSDVVHDRGRPVRGARRACTGRRASRGTARRRTCCSRATPPTSTPSAAGSARRPSAARRRPGPTARTAAASRCARRGARPRAIALDADRRALVRRGRRRHGARRGRRPRRRSARRATVARRAGGWLLREAGAPGLDGFGARAAERARCMRRIKAAFDPTGQVLARPAARWTGDGDDRAAPPARRVGIRSTRTSSSRAWRAGCACRTARPTASPGSRSRLAARPHRGDARGRARRRAARRRVPRRDGRVRAVPRLRGRVPVGGAVRPPHGGHQRRARRAPAARRRCASTAVGSPSGVAYTLRAPAPRGAARAHLGAARRPAPPPRAAALRPARALEPLAAHAARSPTPTPADAWLFTGCVMDAWQRDTHRAALRVMRADGRARRPARVAAATAAARCTRTPGGRRRATTGPAGDRVDAGRRAGRRRQRRLRRGDEGLRPAARHPGRGGVLARGSSTSPSGSRPAAAADCTTPARPSWCRTRATCATCSGRTARCAPCSRRRTAWRDRRRRPVLRRRRRVLGAPTRALGRHPRPQGRGARGRAP